MKKRFQKSIVAFFLFAFVLGACLNGSVNAAFAADTAALSGPGAMRAGDTITVSFKVEGTNISGMEGRLSYDASQLTFVSWKQVISSKWKIKMNGDTGKFVAYDETGTAKISSGTLFSVTFKVNAHLEVGTAVTVSFTDVKLSAGAEDIPVGTVSYTKTILEPLSADNLLSSLSVGYTLTPAFDPNVLNYSVTVPFEVSALDITAAAKDTKSAVKTTKPYLKANGHTTVTVTVTAENGAQRIYSIDVFREQDPNYQPSDVSSLKSLLVKDFFLSPAFSEERFSYVLWLPYEVSSLEITGHASDSKAQGVTVDGADELKVGVNYVYVTVTAEDGISKSVYTITANRAQNPDYEEEPLPPVEPVSNNAVIAGIILETTTDGEKYTSAMFGFNPEVYDYNFTLDEDVTGFSLAATPEDEAAMVRILGNMHPEKGETVDAVVLCTAPDGVTTQTYVIHVTRLGDADSEWKFGMLEVGVACAVAMALGASAAAAIIGISAAAAKRKSQKHEIK